MMTKRSSIAIAIVVIGLTACGTSKSIQKNSQDLIQGTWIVESMEGKEVDNAVRKPYFIVEGNTISGNGGCNSYTSNIEKLTSKEILLGKTAATLMACSDENKEDIYFQLLDKVNTYKIVDDKLIIRDASGNEILTFKSDNMAAIKKELSGEWNVKSIYEKEVTDVETRPTINFDFNEGRVFGIDACNNYFGAIKNITEKTLELGLIGSTRKMCADMTIPDSFSKALNEVVSYQLKEEELILINETGNHVLTFIR